MNFRSVGRAVLRLVAPPPAARFGVELPPELAGLLRGEGVARRVSRAEALQVGAVARARDMIAGTLATLPLEMIAPGKRPVDWPLFEQPDPDIAKSVVLSYTFEDLLFEGEAWWRVVERDGRGFPTRALHVPIGSVHVGGAAALPSVSRITPDQPEPRTGQVFIDGIPVPDSEVIHFLSPNPPLLVHAARAIRTALRLERTVEMYANEPLPVGYFRKREGVDAPADDEVQGILDDWDEARRRKAWGYVGGLEPVPLAFNPQQLELVGNRREAVVEIARHAGLDPEDLGVSTTSRSYANIEQRRQDLLTFTLGAYVSAVQDRLSMRDVAPRGHVARFKFAGFLRTDTLGRYQAYEIGQRVGAVTEDEVRELEDRPPLTPAQKARKDRLNGVEPVTMPSGGARMSNGQGRMVELAPLKLSASEPIQFRFDDPEVDAAFKVDAEARTVQGVLIPWGKVAHSAGQKWRFKRGSLSYVDERRIKLNVSHNRYDISDLVGVATRIQNGSHGLVTTFKIAKGAEGDRVLSLAQDGILDGLSAEVDFTSDDDFGPDPKDPSVNLVESGVLRGAALTGWPAFDDARLTGVKASRDGGGKVPEDKKDAPDDRQGTVTLEADQFAGFMEGLAGKVAESHRTLTEQLSGSLGDSISAGIKAALENMHDPQRDGPEPVRAARFVVTREAPIYSFDGQGPSLVRDAWYAQREHDDDAKERIRRFHQQSTEVQKLAASWVSQQAATQAARAQIPGAQFATVTTGTASDVIPPGYRPDLFVPQLTQGRPLYSMLSRGTIANATPFVVPTFGSLTGGTGDHTEGAAPAEGTLVLGSQTVTPGAISGKLPLTREIVDSSNPAIDTIALNAMRESYSQQTESKVYTALNGAAAAANTENQSLAALPVTDHTLIEKVRDLLARYPFVRFAAPNGAAISQLITRSFAGAKDTTNRQLLPSVGAQNASGLGNAVTMGWFVDGLAFVPAWAITETVGDDVVLIMNSMDAWAWESPILAFRFEEKSGPQIIELALFGYFATHVLRPAGVFAVRLIT